LIQFLQFEQSFFIPDSREDIRNQAVEGLLFVAGALDFNLFPGDQTHQIPCFLGQAYPGTGALSGHLGHADGHFVFHLEGLD